MRRTSACNGVLIFHLRPQGQYRREPAEFPVKRRGHGMSWTGAPRLSPNRSTQLDRFASGLLLLR